MAFEKGQSGNPGGRPKVVAEIRALAQTHSTAALERLVELMSSEDGRVAVAACNSILDRAYGKPMQALEVEARVSADPREFLAGLLGRVVDRGRADSVAVDAEPVGS